MFCSIFASVFKTVSLCFLGLLMGGKTKDGFGMIFGVNHLGHFLLTVLLLDRLKECGPSRVVTVSSLAHLWGKVDFNCISTHKDLALGNSDFALLRMYSHSKLCNILFTHELAKRLKGTNVTCYSLHPGLHSKHLTKHVKFLCFKTHMFLLLFYIQEPSKLTSTIKAPCCGGS